MMSTRLLCLIFIGVCFGTSFNVSLSGSLMLQGSKSYAQSPYEMEQQARYLMNEMMQEYENLEVERVETLSSQLIQLSSRARRPLLPGLAKYTATAYIYKALLVSINQPSNQYRIKSFFVKAIEVFPPIKLSENIRTPQLESLFNQAQQQKYTQYEYKYSHPK